MHVKNDIWSGVSVFHLVTITKKVCTAKNYIMSLQLTTIYIILHKFFNNVYT